MADISYPQIVHDIKEKYIEATGEPDNVKYGEIAQDVYDAITSGGSNIGYEVKFTVDGNDYYVAQCLQGESITEPPTPKNPNFTEWETEPLETVEFPFTPIADTEINAYLTPYNFLAKGGDVICKVGGRTYTDVDGSSDIVAYGKFGIFWTPILLVTAERSSYYTGGTSSVITNVTYDGTLYYVVSGGGSNTDISDQSGLYRYRFTDVADNLTGWQSAALEVLDAYFNYTKYPIMPLMQQNEFVTKFGDIELTSSEVFGRDATQQALFQPYKALDRKTGETGDGTYFLEKNTQGFWCIKYPYYIRLKKLLFVNTYSTVSQYYTRTLQFYADENMTIPIGNQITANQVWQNIIVYDDTDGIVTDTIYMKAISGYAGIGELRIYGDFVGV